MTATSFSTGFGCAGRGSHAGRQCGMVGRVRLPFRRRTPTAHPGPLPVPGPIDAIAAEGLAQARAEADRVRWDELSPRVRARATREAWRWMLAARAAGFTLTTPPSPTPPGYTSLPAGIARTTAVDPALLVTCETCGCVINRLDRTTHARFHARVDESQQATVPLP
jgi:hypothetical protein